MEIKNNGMAIQNVSSWPESWIYRIDWPLVFSDYAGHNALDAQVLESLREGLVTAWTAYCVNNGFHSGVNLLKTDPIFASIAMPETSLDLVANRLTKKPKASTFELVVYIMGVQCVIMVTLLVVFAFPFCFQCVKYFRKNDVKQSCNKKDKDIMEVFRQQIQSYETDYQKKTEIINSDVDKRLEQYKPTGRPVNPHLQISPKTSIMRTTHSMSYLTNDHLK